MKTLKINCNDQSFILHSSGAVFWNKESMLLIADVHLGKVTHFRKHGSAIPQESISQNFKALAEVVAYFKPKFLCFLGDLFHSYINNEWLLFENFIGEISCDVILISGNHDIIPTSMYDKIGVEVIQELVIKTFLLTHHPENRIGFFNFSGHIHPGVKLLGFGKQFLSLSCFYRTKNQIILPAFGSFTGKFIIQPKKEDHIYVITDNEVIEMKN